MRKKCDYYTAGAGKGGCGSPWSYTSEKYRAVKIMKTGFMTMTRTQPMNGISDRITVMII
jgi:hypothetical protein